MANRDITIKRNNGGTIDALLPTTHVGQIFTDSTLTTTLQSVLDAKIASTEKGAANGVAPLDGTSKILPTYLPNWVGGGLVYRGTIASGDIANAGALITAVQGLVTSGSLASASQLLGSSWVVTANYTFVEGTLPANTAISFNPGDEGDSTLPIDLEAGDMVVLTNYVDSTTDTFTFAVINNTYTDATDTVKGIVKLGSSTAQSVAANSVSATASRTYAIQNDSNGKLVVNVPWTDTDTNTTYTAGVGLVLTGTTFKANLIDETLQSVTAQSITTTANRTYAVMPDADGDLVVNVPWSDTNTTYSMMTSTTLGLGKLEDDTTQTVAANAVSATAGRTYGVQKNASDQLVVNVPWTDTTYSTATSSANGLVKLGSDTAQTVAANAVTATASRSYAVQLNASGQMVVNVPWTDTDTNTTYTAGVGLALSGTTFKADLIDETLRSVTAESITTTANRTYAVMPDADGDLVVNVPWTDTDTNTYVSSAAFNTGTGILTLTRNDASTVTVDLDGKYLEASDLTNRPEVFYANTTPTTGWSDGDLWLDYAG